MEKEMIFSYVVGDYVEYIPPINYDAYDEYQECEFYI